MKQEIQNPFRGNNCFFCGSENKEGLHLKFYWDEDKKETSAEFLPPPHFVGQGNILHGAFQMGLMDEIMGWTSYVYSQQMSVTTDMNVKFLHPVYIRGERIYVACRVTFQEGPRVHMEASLSNVEGRACTTATGTFRILPPERFHKLIHGE